MTTNQQDSSVNIDQLVMSLLFEDVPIKDILQIVDDVTEQFIPRIQSAVASCLQGHLNAARQENLLREEK